MMTHRGILALLFGAALVSGVALCFVSEATVVPMIARGTGPNGIQVTSSGWVALSLSLLGTGGFTFAGIVTMLARRLGLALPQRPGVNTISEIIELTAAFAALMGDKSSRAAQRRFFFALVDAARLIHGCETTHDGGVIIIKYSGYADPVAAVQEGANP